MRVESNVWYGHIFYWTGSGWEQKASWYGGEIKSNLYYSNWETHTVSWDIPSNAPKGTYFAGLQLRHVIWEFNLIKWKWEVSSEYQIGWNGEVFKVKSPSLPKGYAYAQIYNADDDSHSAYVYVDGVYKGSVYVPAGSTRDSSHYEVDPGYHTVGIEWYDADDGNWHSKSNTQYVSGGEYKQYYFELERIVAQPPVAEVAIATDKEAPRVDEAYTITATVTNLGGDAAGTL